MYTEQHCCAQCPKNYTYTLARFEPTIVCSVVGDDDQAARAQNPFLHLKFFHNKAFLTVHTCV
jgi:hypothetical protein